MSTSWKALLVHIHTGGVGFHRGRRPVIVPGNIREASRSCSCPNEGTTGRQSANGNLTNGNLH
eukprot:1449776-Rhodomonas_salina.1